MKITAPELKFDARLIVLLLFIMIVLLSNIMLFFYYKQNKKEIIESYIHELNTQFIITASVYSDMSDSIFHLHINNDRVKGILARAVSTRDKKEKNMLRQQLLTELMPLYHKITAYNFRQLHFHEKNNRSFLRFHRPDKYGDDLTKFRYSVKYANREKRSISGFEEGRIFNGYRYIYPLEYKNRHIGSVEISISMKTVISHLKNRFYKDTQFILLKSQVDKKVFKSEQSNYIPWAIDDRFVLDKAVEKKCILKNHLAEIDKNKIQHALSLNTKRGAPFCLEVTMDGESALLTFLPIKNFLAKNVAYIFSVSDDTKLQDQKMSFILVFTALNILLVLLILFSIYYKISQKKIEDMATFDFLTHIYSRRILFKELEAEFDRYQRYEKSFSLIMIDIDHFKKINDTHGHGAGDAVLKGIAEIIKSRIRKSDILGRYGGEEFIILLPETKKDKAAVAAENLRKAVSSSDFHRIGTVTISCGVTEMNDRIDTVEKLIDEADKKLYQAKEGGRNRVVS